MDYSSDDLHNKIHAIAEILTILKYYNYDYNMTEEVSNGYTK